MGALWETGSFLTRALGAHDQQNQGYSMTSQLLVLLAPLCAFHDPSRSTHLTVEQGSTPSPT